MINCSERMCDGNVTQMAQSTIWEYTPSASFSTFWFCCSVPSPKPWILPICFIYVYVYTTRILNWSQCMRQQYLICHGELLSDVYHLSVLTKSENILENGILSLFSPDSGNLHTVWGWVWLLLKQPKGDDDDDNTHGTPNIMVFNYFQLSSVSRGGWMFRFHATGAIVSVVAPYWMLLMSGRAGPRMTSEKKIISSINNNNFNSLEYRHFSHCFVGWKKNIIQANFFNDVKY